MVSLNMILEHLDGCRLLSAPPRMTKRFAHISFLRGESSFDQDADASKTPASTAALSSNELILYCGSAAAAESFAAAREKDFVLCIQSEPSVSPALRSLRSQVIVLQSSEPVSSSFDRIEHLFFSINSWTRSMKNAVLDGGDYQSLIDRSEPILKNFISVSNSEFRLLAYSRHTPIEDPVAQSLIKSGVHSPETVKLFKKYRVAKDWETQTKIERKPASELTAHEVLDYVFRIQGNYFIHVNMHCNVIPPTAALVDAFQLLVEHMEYCVKRDWNERFLQEQEPSRLFGDLIAHKPQNEKAFADRLESTGIPKAGSFLLVAFKFQEHSRENKLLPYYANHLKEAFPGCHIGIHGVYALMLYTHETDPAAEERRLLAFSETYPCSIGVSNRFSNITDFAFAFQQSKNAIEIALSPRQSLAARYSEKKDSPIYRFDAYFPSYIAETARTNNHLVEYCVQNGIVPKIAAFDEQHGTNDLKTLFLYLICERKVSAACEALFLHRNTLLYRIEKMQDRFGFNLDDPNVRQQIMLEYSLYSPE